MSKDSEVSRRRFVQVISAAIAGATQAGAQSGAPPTKAKVEVDSARLQRVLNRAAIIDLHADTTQLILDEGYDLGKEHTYAQIDIPRLRRGHVAGIFLASNPNSRLLSGPASVERALDEVDAIRREVARHPADLVLTTSADQIVAAKAQGKVGVSVGLEGGHIIDSDLAVLRSFYQLGARYMTLTHFTNTPWADASGQPPEHNGLTGFGRQVVREMNRLGMMVDISHVADKTFWDTLEVSEAPIIASHSSCRALCSHWRNMTDEMLRALGRKGGVVHINFFEAFLDQDFLNRYNFDAVEAEELQITKQFAGDPQRRGEELRKLQAERIARLGRIPFDRLLDHFQHAVEIAGIDHVGLGSDFDGVSDQLPEGMEDISKEPNIVRGLLERGFSDAEVEKIVGGNTLRVMREIERT
jgi:membrane dipeptidase